jgi:hypothetical protein
MSVHQRSLNFVIFYRVPSSVALFFFDHINIIDICQTPSTDKETNRIPVLIPEGPANSFLDAADQVGGEAVLFLQDFDEEFFLFLRRSGTVDRS